jgi:hypothetical protein
MKFLTQILSIFAGTLVLGSNAVAQSSQVPLAAQTFVDACIATQGDGQLAKLSLARSGVFPKKKRAKGLFGEDLGGSMDSYTHVGGEVFALVMPSRIGKDFCMVGIDSPADLNATNLAIATALAESVYASSPKVTARKKGKRTVYTVQFGQFKVTVDKSLAGKNSVINMR